MNIVDTKIELFSTEPALSARFYEVLGFSVNEHKPSGYMTLQNPVMTLALSPLPFWLPIKLFNFLRFPPLGTEIVFYVDELDLCRQQLVDAGFRPGNIATQSWGDKDFRVRDPDGYYIRISEGKALAN